MPNFRDQFTSGHGYPQAYSQTWITGLEYLGASDSVGYGPDDSELIGDPPEAIDLVYGGGQRDPVNNVLHILAKLTDSSDPDSDPPADSTVTLTLWVNPVDNDNEDYFLVDVLEKPDQDADSCVWTLHQIPPGKYYVGVADLTTDARVEVNYCVSG